jgi:hypothetical protein
MDFENERRKKRVSSITGQRNALLEVVVTSERTAMMVSHFTTE